MISLFILRLRKICSNCQAVTNMIIDNGSRSIINTCVIMFIVSITYIIVLSIMSYFYDLRLITNIINFSILSMKSVELFSLIINIILGPYKELMARSATSIHVLFFILI